MSGKSDYGKADFGFDPSDFDDVAALDLDVTRIAHALGMSIDRTDVDLLGRVALKVVEDPRWGAPPTVTDVNDPWVKLLADRQREAAPVQIEDVNGDARGLLPPRGLRLDYAHGVTRTLPGDLQLALEPRANLLVGNEVSGLGGGALVRFGRNLTAPRDHQRRWYAFIGADAQALTWQLGDDELQEHNLRLEDKQLIGDYQAGVAMRTTLGDFSLGYVDRKVRWNDVSRQEKFFGVSFTMKR
jgi:hypothetical protein